MAVQLVAREQRIPPSRGLVLARNHSGRSFALIDLLRWIRSSRLVLKAEKIDLLADGDAQTILADLLPAAHDLGVALSLRTDASAPPESLRTLKDQGLFDVFLCPKDVSLDALEPWSRACVEAELPLRLQLQAPFPENSAPDDMAAQIAGAGVVRVNLALSDPFLKRGGCRDGDHSQATLDFMQQLAGELETRGVESNLLDIPLCLVDKESLQRTANAPQCAVDHAHYLPEANALAQKLYGRGPIIAGKILLMLLSRDTFKSQPMDNLLLPALLHQHYLYIFFRMFRRLTIHMRIVRSVPKAVTREDYDRELRASHAESRKKLGPVCGECALKRICDHAGAEFRRICPGLEIQAVAGEHVVSPLHFSVMQPKYYDALDVQRIDNERSYEALAGEAERLLSMRPPDLELGPYDYGVVGTYFNRMESGVKWWSVSNMEKLSTVLGTFSPPLTMSMDVGAGIADYVGFSFGRHCKILCPMEAYRHNVTLHVDADGRYILLRDKRPVRPVEFEGQHYLPLRLGGRLQPRISVWNIDECLATQNLRIWLGDRAEGEAAAKVKYSIIIVSTRFTRRLHAVLRSLAHQRDFDLSKVEVIICYVPGMDATDDLIDGATLVYPELRITRSPFTEEYANSKGFMINESAKAASGEWIMLLDSDTLLPPDYFAKVDAVSEDSEFIAPDGRKLLPKDVTARILLGELDPWDHWEELLEGEGEFRHRETLGIPVGFCQCFRAQYIEEYPYLEEDHFETADMQFGAQMREHVGHEHRLSGTPVIHLDHGGSQWYGTQKHM